MKIHLRITVILFAVTLLLSGCNKWLSITPDNSISKKDLFSSGYGFRNALNGIYIHLADQDLFGRELTWGFLSAIAQEYDQSNRVSNPIYTDAIHYVYNSPTTTPIIAHIWEKSYTIIANLNELISNIEKSKDTEFEYGEDEKNLIYAEALSLRALIHFYLLRLYAPAPITQPTGKYIPYREVYSAKIGEKLTVKDFIEKILKDISVAEPKLRHWDQEVHPEAMYSYKLGSATPEWSAVYRFKSAPYMDDMGRFFWYRGLRMNHMALLALKASVCMYAGPSYYRNAQTAAKELYNTYYEKKKWLGFTPQRMITITADKRYTKLSHDVLFGLYVKNLANDYNSDVWRTSTASSTTRLPLAHIRELFSSDISGIYTDYRYEYLIAQTNETDAKPYSLKYEPSADNDVSEMENNLVPLLRFSEVCHILAETEAYFGNLSEAIKYLELVRHARGAQRSITATTNEELMQEILADRKKEEMAEGRLFFTYKRMNMLTIRSANNDNMVRVNYVLPIPLSETTN